MARASENIKRQQLLRPLIVGGSELRSDPTHISPFSPPVQRVAEAVMFDNVSKAGEGEEEGHDPRHPSEGHDRCQESTRAEIVAPVKFSPLLGGDGGTNDPQGEEDKECDQFATKR